MTLRQANAIGRRVAAAMVKIFHEYGDAEDRTNIENEIESELSALGYSFRSNEVFFVRSGIDEKRPRYIILDYLIEDLVILRNVSWPDESLLEYRLLWSLMQVSGAKAAVRVNFEERDVDDAVLFCDVNTAYREMLPPQS